MKFGLFVVLNALLLIRPEELFPEITGLRLYLIVIALCTLITLPELLRLLTPESLRVRPVTVCVLLYFASTIVSLCVLRRFEEAFLDFGPEFAKVILYYLLLVSIVDNATRFRTFVATLIFFVIILTAIALAQQFGIASFPNIQPAMQRVIDPATGEESAIPRLCSSGVFSDPNDLCLILGLGILSCIFMASTGEFPLPARLIWLLPIPLFVFAVLETHSRGGLMGVLAGICGYLFARFGGPKSLPYAAAGVVAVFAAIGGRQGGISGGDTAHERLMLWTVGLTNLFNMPLYIPTGLGMEWYVEESGHVAHNSFIQTYVEQGIFGGGAFLGAFVIGAFITYRLGRTIQAPAWAMEVRPFVFAVICGYAMGCYSLSRNLVLPTYMVFGIVAVVVESPSVILPEKFTVTRRWFFRCVLLSIAGLVAIKFATQLLGMAGV